MSNSLNEKREIVQSKARDKTAKIIAGLVPMGSAAYELITTIVVPLHEKKKREFLNDLADRLKKLEEKGKIDFQELADSEKFNTIITKAILLAQQNHQEEKLEALKSFVINYAGGVDSEIIEYDHVEYFLSFIERLNPFHIILLKIFQDPKNFDKSRWEKIDYEVKVHIIDLFLTMYPEMEKKVSIVMQAWKDLYNFGFIELQTMKSVKHTKFSLKKLTTDFGDQFLKMIEKQ